MINKFFFALYAHLLTFRDATTARVATHRGAGFIEYALLCAIAAAVFFVLKAFLPGFVTGILNSLNIQNG